MISDIIVVTSLALTSMTPILLGSVGEIFTEKSGVVNIGIEGIFLLSALISLIITFETEDPYLGLFTGFLIGAFAGFIHAVFAVYLKSDQIIVGVGFNMLAYGATVLMMVSIWQAHGASPTLPTKTYVISIPLGRDVITIHPLSIMAIGLAILFWWILEKTSLGLKIRACGEDPKSAEASGVNVYLMRIIATTVGGGLAGLGGAFLTVSWIGQFTRNISAGRGFIALANVAFSNWNPLTAILGALIFGIFDVLALYLPIKLSSLYGIVFTTQNNLFLTIPYLATIIIVMIISRRIKMPRSLGTPYIKE